MYILIAGSHGVARSGIQRMTDVCACCQIRAGSTVDMPGMPAQCHSHDAELTSDVNQRRNTASSSL